MVVGGLIKVLSRTPTAVKKFSITIADETDRLLRGWAEIRGQPKTTLAGFLVERGVEDARDKGYIKAEDPSPRSEAKDQPDPTPLIRLIEIITEGGELEPGAIAQAALVANVDPVELSLKLEKLKNGNGTAAKA